MSKARAFRLFHGPASEDQHQQRPRAPRDEGAERDEDDAGRVGRVPPFKPADRVREVRREDDSGAGRETKSGGEGAGREGREARQQDGRRHGGPRVGRRLRARRRFLWRVEARDAAAAAVRAAAGHGLGLGARWSAGCGTGLRRGSAVGGQDTAVRARWLV